MGQGTQHDRIVGRGASTFDKFANTATIVITGATPAVSGGNVFKTNNGGAVTITNFTGGTDTQQIVIICGESNTIIANNSSISIAGGTNFTCVANTGIAFVYDASQSKWIENGGTGTGGGGGGGAPGSPTNSIQKNSGSGTFVASGLSDDGTTVTNAENSSVAGNHTVGGTETVTGAVADNSTLTVGSLATLNGETVFRGPSPYNDIRSFGGVSSVSSTTATCTNTSTAVTLALALDFKDASAYLGSSVGNGIVLYKCGAATGLSTPPAPTIIPYGITGGATTYSYQYVAQDRQGGLTAAGTAGTTSTGAATLGMTTVNLTAVTWNSTANGEQVYTCSANCNISVNTPIRIDGFANSRFNGNYTVIATNGTNQFTVYAASIPAPSVTTESIAATAKALACNSITMPANTVGGTVEGASGDTVLRWIVYRNGTLAFYAQARDPYYEDCGVTTPGGNFESFVPTSPGAAVNKYLATTIVSGAGTTSIVVANAAGNNISGVTALHDNSKNLLACYAASLNNTPCYDPITFPYNAATIFTSGNGMVLLPYGATLSEPWVVATSGIRFEGGMNNGNPSFQFANTVNLSGGGAAFPTVIVQQGHGNPSMHGVQFKNITLTNLQLGGEAFVADIDVGTLFGLLMDNVGFGSTTNTANVNIPAAVFKGLSESSIGMPGNRNACTVAQVAPGPPCMRFTTVSVAQNSGVTGNASVARNVQINGFAMQGGAFQFDAIPWINSGGTSPFGATDILFRDGLREVGKNPYLRSATVGSFSFYHIDDDAPNTTVSNGWVDAASSQSGSNSYYFEGMTSSGGGLFGVTGKGGITIGPGGGLSPITADHTGYIAVNSGTSDVLLANGTAEIGFQMITPAAPGVALGAGGSCVSSCVAAGTWFYSTTSVDPSGNQSLQSLRTSVTTDGTKTVTVTPGIVAGQIAFNPIRGTTNTNGIAIFSTGPAGGGFGGTSYVDGAFFYTFSLVNLGLGTSSSIGASGINTSSVNLTGAGFKSSFIGTFTANRTQTFPDNTGTVANTNFAQTWSNNQTGMALITPSIGGETVSAAPRGPYNVVLPGALTTTWTGETWTLDKAITVTRVQAQVRTAPSGCGTSAIVRLTDGSTPVNLTIAAAANDSGAIAQNYAAGAVLTTGIQTAAATCTTSPGDANVIIQFRMQ